MIPLPNGSFNAFKWFVLFVRSVIVALPFDCVRFGQSQNITILCLVSHFRLCRVQVTMAHITTCLFLAIGVCCSTHFVAAQPGKCASGGSGAATACCNMLRQFLHHYQLAYRNSRTQVSVCRRLKNCALCGTSSASDPDAAARNQAGFDKYVAFFEANDCWDDEIACRPGNAVETLEARDDFGTNMACGKCNLNTFKNPAVTVGACTNDFQMNWWLFGVVVEGVAIVALAVVVAVLLYRRRASPLHVQGTGYSAMATTGH